MQETRGRSTAAVRKLLPTATAGAMLIAGLAALPAITTPAKAVGISEGRFAKVKGKTIHCLDWSSGALNAAGKDRIAYWTVEYGGSSTNSWRLRPGFAGGWDTWVEKRRNDRSVVGQFRKVGTKDKTPVALKGAKKKGPRAKMPMKYSTDPGYTGPNAGDDSVIGGWVKVKTRKGKSLKLDSEFQLMETVPDFTFEYFCFPLPDDLPPGTPDAP